MDIEKIIAGLAQIENGFRHIMQAGDELLSAAPSLNHYATALGLLRDKRYQARMLGTYILGLLASGDPRALDSLRSTVVKDDNWRVQEMLAKAFDHYCSATGYQQALNQIESWLSDFNPKINRAVTEGLRVWTLRPYFKDHPELAIKMLSRHRASDSEYLRKSVGNALRDIWKRHPALIEKEILSWDASDAKIRFTMRLCHF